MQEIKQNMKTLTQAEEEIMQILWKLKKGFLRDVLQEFAEPRPHPNTVATVLKVLVEKKFVDVEIFGRMHRYFTLVEKKEYSNRRINSLVKKYYGGSFTSIVSSMVKEKNLSIEDLEMLLKEFKKKK